MRATTFSTPNVSRATRAAMMLVLSPLLQAAKAWACATPDSISVSRSNPTPTMVVPPKSGLSLRKDSGSMSMIATEWP